MKRSSKLVIRRLSVLRILIGQISHHWFARDFGILRIFKNVVILNFTLLLLHLWGFCLIFASKSFSAFLIRVFDSDPSFISLFTKIAVWLSILEIISLAWSWISLNWMFKLKKIIQKTLKIHQSNALLKTVPSTIFVSLLIKFLIETFLSVLQSDLLTPPQTFS